MLLTGPNKFGLNNKVAMRITEVVHLSCVWDQVEMATISRLSYQSGDH